jgi:tRNA_anti-like
MARAITNFSEMKTADRAFSGCLLDPFLEDLCMKAHCLLLLAFLAAGVLATGCGKSTESAGKGPTSAAEPGPAPAKAAFTGTAQELAKQFSEDKPGFNKKYKDQIVEVDGEVMDPKFTPIAFSLYGHEPKDGPTIVISCYPGKASMAKMADLTAKKKVKVRGKVAARDSMPFGVEIIECDITDK